MIICIFPCLQLRRACGWQLPPRWFWFKWSEGLTLLEGLLVAAWGAVHVILVHYLVEYYMEQTGACKCSNCKAAQPKLGIHMAAQFLLAIAKQPSI
jgi:hypothetical protein